MIAAYDKQFLYLTGASVAIISLVYWITTKSKLKWIKVCKLNKLIIYPVKGLEGVEVDHLDFTKTSVKYKKFQDRNWIVLDENKCLIGTGSDPKLVFTKCRFVGEDEVAIEAPGMKTLILKLVDQIDESHKIVDFMLYNKSINGIECSHEVNEWFENYLNKPGVKVYQHHPDLKYRPTKTYGRRKDEEDYPIIYQGKSSLHLVNQKSVDDLNSRFETNNQVNYNNFRPNILVDTSPAWDEDSWLHMSINKVKFLQLIKCNRCPTTTVNRSTGEKGQETLQVLRKYRPTEGITKKMGLGPTFGSIFGVVEGGRVHVNDPIFVSYGKVEF